MLALAVFLRPDYTLNTFDRPAYNYSVTQHLHNANLKSFTAKLLQLQHLHKDFSISSLCLFQVRQLSQLKTATPQTTHITNTMVRARDDLSDSQLFRLCVYYIYNHPASIMDTVQIFNHECNPNTRLRSSEVKPTYIWLLDTDHPAFERFRRGAYCQNTPLLSPSHTGIARHVPVALLTRYWKLFSERVQCVEENMLIVI